MATEYTSGYCNNCTTDMKLQRKAPNHILHLLITVVLGFFTMGVGALLWVIVWILISIRFGGWICSTCGSKDVKVKQSHIKPLIYIGLALLIVMLVNTSKAETKNVSTESIKKEDIRTNLLDYPKVLDGYVEESMIIIFVELVNKNDKALLNDICTNIIQRESQLFNNKNTFIEVRDISNGEYLTSKECILH